jgi:hypothetical protein
MERTRQRWEGNIGMDFLEAWGGMDWIKKTKGNEHLVSIKHEEFLDSLQTC